MSNGRRSPFHAGAASAACGLGLLSVLSGCNSSVSVSVAEQALSSETLALMAEKGVTPESPMLIRAYKKESELEVWKMRPDGTYVLLKSLPDLPLVGPTRPQAP